MEFILMSFYTFFSNLNFLLLVSAFLCSLYLVSLCVHPSPAIHRLATNVNEAL